MIIFEIVFWSSIILLGSVFFFYPLTIYLLTFFYKEKIAKGNYEPTVSIIVAAYNEEEVMEKKIQNCLSLNYPDEKIEIIVVSDGSTDNTNAIVRKYNSLGLIRGKVIDENRGKTTAINEAVSISTSDYLVFTDANVILDENAIKQLMMNFLDKKVGCVCGQLNYFNEGESRASETGGMYWQYEEFIKKMESKTGSTMGADGSIFAIRSELFIPLKDFLIDDFSTSIRILFQGYRIILDPSAKAYERHSTDIKEELKRRHRIANRMFTAIMYFKKYFLKLDLLNIYKFTFHKLLRYFSCLFMVMAFLMNILLIGHSYVYNILFTIQTIFYFSTVIGYLFQRLNKPIRFFYISYYFVMMNWKQLAGVTDSLVGKRQVKWTSPKGTR